MSGVPPVVLAHRAALEMAARAGFEGVLEVAVEKAIMRGRINQKPLAGAEPLQRGERFVFLSGELAVRVAKDGRTAGGRKRLRALRVERLQPGAYKRRERRR